MDTNVEVVYLCKEDVCKEDAPTICRLSGSAAKAVLEDFHFA